MKTNKKATSKDKIVGSIVICAAAILLVTGAIVAGVISSSQNQNDEVIEQDDAAALPGGSQAGTSRVMRHTSTINIAYNPANPNDVAGLSTNIAIVHIDSLDRADNYSAKVNQSVAPFSYGKMTVLNNLVGSLPEDASLTFYRLGGTISVEKYLAGLSETERSKMENLKNSYDYVEYKFDEGDINIEAGKTYLVYLVKDNVYSGNENAYEIVGFQGGLREIQTSSTGYSVNSDPSDLKVLNNFTGEWENLGNVVKQDK